MSRRVSSGFTRIRLLGPAERHVEGDLIPLDDEFCARSFLERFLFDSYDMMVLRDLYAERIGSSSLSHMSDREVIEALARSISAGEVRVVREPEFVPSGSRVRRPEPEEPVLAAPVIETKHWIKFRVVDDATSEPIPGIVLHVREPSGLEHDYTTRPDGMVEINEIDPGACGVSCGIENARLSDTLAFVAMGEAPTGSSAAETGSGGATADSPSTTGSSRTTESSSWRRIARIDEHKVQTGETLESLASSAGLTWQQLAEFNWDTSVPEQVNEHLRDDVGCTQRTADGNNYVFSSEDEPGIIYIPQPWTQEGLATEACHTFRVRQFAPSTTPRVGWIHVRFLTPHYYPIPRIPSRLLGDKDQWPLKKTNDEGDVSWDNVPLGEYQIELQLGGPRLVTAVPWLRDGTQVHEQRLMRAHVLLGAQDDVRGIQVRLLGLGYDCGQPDGVLGPRTRSAVAAFQRDHGVDPDSTSGAPTNRAIADIYGA